jgi:hypothetical protein
MTRSQAARVAALSLHAQRDSKEVTAPARSGFLSRFERQVDPDGALSEAERARRAEAALRAHMIRLAARSAKARSRGDAT